MRKSLQRAWVGPGVGLLAFEAFQVGGWGWARPLDVDVFVAIRFLAALLLESVVTLRGSLWSTLKLL